MNRRPAPRPSQTTFVARFWERLIRRALTAGPLLTALVATALAGLVAYGLYSSFISPIDDETRATRTRLATLQRENSANLQIQQTTTQFIAEFRRVLEKYDRARDLLPEEVEVSNVLAAVQEMAARHGVRMTRFNSTSPGVKSPFADRLYERAVPATVVGDHDAIVRFFADVARYPRIIHVREIAITALKKTESVDFTLVTFYSPPTLPPVPAELLAERRKVPGATQGGR